MPTPLRHDDCLGAQHADFDPGGLEGGLEGRVQRLAVLERLQGERLEVRLRTDAVGTAVGGVPDLERALPGIAADRTREVREHAVGDARVDVHAAIVGPARVEVLHVGRLRVLADGLVVVRGARVEHIAQSAAVDLLGPQTGADQPGVLVGRQTETELAAEHADDVGEVLVEGARLALVDQAGGLLGDAVRHLVTDDVVDDEGREELAVAVAVRHLAAVPEGVVVLATVVHGADEGHALVVDRVALHDLGEEVLDAAVEGVRVVDDGIAGGGIAFEARLGAGQRLLVLRVVDLALTGAGASEQAGETAGESETLLNQALVLDQGVEEGDVAPITRMQLVQQMVVNETFVMVAHMSTLSVVEVRDVLRLV